MNAARIISPPSSTDIRRTKPILGGGQKDQRSKSLDAAALFYRHYLPLSHQSSTAAKVAAASFDRTTAHPSRSAPARERCGSSGLRSAHLDRVSVSQLVRRNPSANAGGMSRAVELDTDAGGRVRPTAGRAAQHAEQRPDGEGRTKLQPRVQLLPCPAVHSDLPALVALAVPYQHGASFRVEIALISASASLIRSPARQSTTITPRNRTPSGLSPAARMTEMISSTVGGSAE